MYKKVDVVMLPTNEKATDIPFSVGITLCNDGKLRIGNPVGYSEKRQHLYIILDEEIKVGDWIYRYEDKKVFQSKAYFSKGNPIKKGLITKIIATTDKSITINGYDSSDEDAVVNCYLPQQFIQYYIGEYNKGNVITEVEVEHLLSLWSGNTLSDRKYGKTILKVNPDDTTNIKPIKESWTKDEVVELLIRAISNCNCSDGELYNKKPHEAAIWIEENL